MPAWSLTYPHDFLHVNEVGKHKAQGGQQPGASGPVVQVSISGSVSSQYLTALLMAAPLATGTEGVEIKIVDELVSQPYVDMTVRLMERFGVQVLPRQYTIMKSMSNVTLPLATTWTVSIIYSDLARSLGSWNEQFRASWRVNPEACPGSSD